MKLQFYKKGQGYYTRLCTAVGCGILAALACYSLWNKLDAIAPGETVSEATKTWLRTGIPAALFLILAWVIFKGVNSIKFADFLIATEGEMKKVSWSTRKEIVASTKIVIISVFLMAIILASVDFGFAWLFNKMGILKVMG